MRQKSPLFRAEALSAERTQALGEVILAQPLSFVFLTGASAAIAACLVGFLVWGTYTEHSTVGGALVPDLGLVELHSPQYGTIVEKHVREGQIVHAGDTLYVISSDRLSSALGPTEKRIELEVGKRLRSLEVQIAKVHAFQHTERASLENMLEDLESEAGNLRSMQRTQSARVKLARQTEARYEALRAQGFVSADALIAKQEDVLDQRSRLQSLERDVNSVSRQLADSRRQLRGLTLKYANQTAELERSISSGRQELMQSEARRRILVTAPTGGTATAVLGQVGQFVDSNKILVSIVPARARLQADLYAPSRAVGFVKVGEPVLLRYEAYPYQKFGHQRGTVVAVSRTALPLSELTGITPAVGRPSEPVYRVTVKLRSQSIDAHGTRRPLQAGMIVQADLLQETRRLYEWVLEPLYTLAGKLP